MKRSLWLNALLLVAVAGLGLFVYLRPKSDAPAEHALSALKPDAATRIQIERGGTAAIALEKKGDAWFLTEPFRARADAARVERLLEIARARATHRMPAADLARFDLERPETRMTIDGESFGFGLGASSTCWRAARCTPSICATARRCPEPPPTWRVANSSLPPKSRRASNSRILQ
ncbi:MAG: hypothetical protein HYV99_03460 [Betaproteobacteria bacterium]|nr:hypothetical protein [Betaproteobacteria bacterium]